MKLYLKQFIKYFVQLIFIMLLLITLFTASLTIIMCIPDSLISEHLDESMEIINYEGRNWASTFTHTMGSRLDNVTDATMLEATFSFTDYTSPFSKAISVNHYSRYWHGYLILLRPLMTIVNYTQIRYIYMFILMLLLCACIISIQKHINTLTAFLFTFVLTTTYFPILANSLQYCSVYFIMLTAVLYILSRYTSSWRWQTTGYLFLIIGALTNFMDFLTAPLLTLGIPLIFIMLLNIKQNNKTAFSQNWKCLANTTFSWVFGYSFSWISKWLLAAAFLDENALHSALSRAALRINGTDEYPVNRLQTLILNLKSLLPPHYEDIPFFSVFVMILFILAVILFILKRKSWNEIKNYFPLLALACYPYIWYLVLTNHSSDHPLFTYRIQIISLFSLLLFYFGCVNIKFKKIRQDKTNG